jgi:aspartokinase-like uncharacterized kinase
VKVGGSLYDLPDLAPRLAQWLDQLPTRAVLLVPGGGQSVGAVRRWDQMHGLGEEASHWLALRALQLNAFFLQSLLPNSRIIERVEESPCLRSAGLVAILDAYAFAKEDDDRPDRLPHSWGVTSDSLAARVAVRAGAATLVLLKSVAVSDRIDWRKASAEGLVDPLFEQVLRQAPKGFQVQVLNFRTWSPPIRFISPPQTPR